MLNIIQRLLVGSRAVRSGLLHREMGRDSDFIATVEGFNRTLDDWTGTVDRTEVRGRKVLVYRTYGSAGNALGNPRLGEFELAYPGDTGYELLELVNQHRKLRENISDGWADVAHPSVLLALKLSHRYRRNSPHFEKTRRDILALRQICEVPEVLREWLVRRERETLAHTPPVLAKPKSDFFTSNVKYVYDHDSIHRVMAMGRDPAYFAYQKEGAEVMVDRAKFEALPFRLRLWGVVEEAMVLAIERHQVPNAFTPDPKLSYKIALQKVCTSITSGWFREFAWTHYDEALASLPLDYVETFKRGVASGVVKPYQGGGSHG